MSNFARAARALSDAFPARNIIYIENHYGDINNYAPQVVVAAEQMNQVAQASRQGAPTDAPAEPQVAPRVEEVEIQVYEMMEVEEPVEQVEELEAENGAIDNEGEEAEDIFEQSLEEAPVIEMFDNGGYEADQEENDEIVTIDEYQEGEIGSDSEEDGEEERGEGGQAQHQNEDNDGGEEGEEEDDGSENREEGELTDGNADNMEVAIDEDMVVKQEEGDELVEEVADLVRDDSDEEEQEGHAPQNYVNPRERVAALANQDGVRRLNEILEFLNRRSRSNQDPAPRRRRRRIARQGHAEAVSKHFNGFVMFLRETSCPRTEWRQLSNEERAEWNGKAKEFKRQHGV